VSTGELLFEPTHRVLSELSASAFLVEPVPRNTAPCIAWAAWKIRERDPEAVILVLPSDHVITDEGAFDRIVERALASAREGTITTIGIEPTRPETGYGYIEVGPFVSEGVRRAVRFVEKPDSATAQQYLEGKRHLWNSGMFFFKAAAMVDAVSRHAPQIYRGIEEIENPSLDAQQQAAVARRVFDRLESISIDFAIMEKVEALSVVPASFGWNDLGSWAAYWELGAKDAQQNLADSEVVFVDAKRNLVKDFSSQKNSRTVALVGVDDLCVIQTDDALLVVPVERSQDVRQVVDALRQAGKLEKI
jgi:mannose-1-phosphate guanylyltransferase